jgi:hypothetical protein
VRGDGIFGGLGLQPLVHLPQRRSPPFLCRVLAFATVVAGLAAALTLALVLAFACVFAIFSISPRRGF